MAGYTVLANRYRPRDFESVVGQEDTARVLRSAIATGRAGHAFLFSGPRGVGKTSMARILAKALNCLENEQGDPCGSCRVCRGIDEGGESLDVVEIDGASHNKVENVRELIENLRFAPVEARYRIYIVDEVHMLSTAAFNALLKTLEEPPDHAKFILATTEPLKVPETIRSRCQQYDFRRLSAEQIAQRLQTIVAEEQVEVPDGLLGRIARHAQGGLRDALSLLDQLITYGEGAPSHEDFERLTGRLPAELLQKLVGAALDGETAAVHGHAADALTRGARPTDLLAQVSELLEGLLVTVAGGEAADRTEEERATLAELAGRANLDQVVAMLDVVIEAARRLRQRNDGRLVVEMALLTLARLPQLQSVADVLAGGAPEPSGPARAAPPTRSRSAPAPSSPPASKPRRAAPPKDAGPRAARSDEPPPPPPATPSPSAAGPAPAAASVDDPRERFLQAVSSRALRLELGGYPRIEVKDGALLLEPPADGPTALYDPRKEDAAKAVRAAAKKAFGRDLRIEVVEGTRKAAPPRPKTSKSSVERRIQEEWPGAERVDF